MTTARVLSRIGAHGEMVFTGTMPDGKFVLEEDLVTYLGVRIPELEAWARDRKLLDTDHESLGAWRVKIEPESTIWRVPSGLIYDGSSFPTLAAVKWMLGPRERYIAAGTHHDDAYQSVAPFRASNRMFCIIASSGIQSVAPWQADVCYAALNAGAWPVWLRYRRAANA